MSSIDIFKEKVSRVYLPKTGRKMLRVLSIVPLLSKLPSFFREAHDSECSLLRVMKRAKIFYLFPSFVRHLCNPSNFREALICGKWHVTFFIACGVSVVLGVDSSEFLNRARCGAVAEVFLRHDISRLIRYNPSVYVSRHVGSTKVSQDVACSYIHVDDTYTSSMPVDGGTPVVLSVPPITAPVVVVLPSSVPVVPTVADTVLKPPLPTDASVYKQGTFFHLCFVSHPDPYPILSSLDVFIRIERVFGAFLYKVSATYKVRDVPVAEYLQAVSRIQKQYPDFAYFSRFYFSWRIHFGIKGFPAGYPKSLTRSV